VAAIAACARRDAGKAEAAPDLSPVAAARNRPWRPVPGAFDPRPASPQDAKQQTATAKQESAT
jgi:hypothetical protein